ncbi:3-isopropylmalate dehydratase small subunit [Aliidongia dinghuensis]|uniref:3-isopropylmalate dehydratase n=1 Tax=Aliidongia dinghuensis TaxID=1867774 RepID=A0A8J2Z1Q6_9PROT|nr:3-isopropylmalate dehydratase small subunit [Aliidongia dinghuensis]GGF50892.1 3-isopropylmalate dehydratase small subunit [Aliidongia dinghuensis]
MPAPLVRLHAIALPLLRDNVDTDELIPVAENTRASTYGWGDGLFAAKRYLAGPGRAPDPDFILNRPPYDRAAMLVSGANFGCGSSRESAVWALRDHGFRVVAAISFNETFKRNCIVNGLAPLILARADAEDLVGDIERDPFAGVSVDLERLELSHGSHRGPADSISFDLDPFYRALLMTGQTEDDMLGALQPTIDAHRHAMLAAQPWLTSWGP